MTTNEDGVSPHHFVSLRGGRAVSGARSMQARVTFILLPFHVLKTKRASFLPRFSSAPSTVRPMSALLLWLYQVHAQLASHGRWEPFWKHFSLHLITGAQRGATWSKLEGWMRDGESEGRREGWRHQSVPALFKLSDLVWKIPTT